MLHFLGIVLFIFLLVFVFFPAMDKLLERRGH